MNDESETTLTNALPQQAVNSSRRFQAHVGQFDDAADRNTIDELNSWVECRFAADLQRRPSKHVYVRTLPEEIIRQIDQLRDSPIVHEAILRQFDANSIITPMKHTD
jgi:hypothetical protein